MSRFPEQRLWDRIHRNIARQVHIERVENAVGVGLPDTLIIHKGRVSWAEHKVAELPVRPTSRLQWKHPLTPEQCNWHLVWAQKGGISWIVVGIETALFAIPGRLVDSVTPMTRGAIDPFQVTYTDLLRLYQKGK